MGQNYYIPHNLTTKLAEKDSQMLRSALRLFFWCKTHGYESSFYIKQLRPVLLDFFQYKQIKKYLQILEAHGYLGKDSHGKYFLRGRKFLIGDTKSKMFGCVIEPGNTETQENWMGFLAACAVVVVKNRIQRADPNLIRSASTPIESGGDAEVITNRGEAPVALSILQSHLNISDATASRLRARAAKAGLITSRKCFIDVSDVVYATNRVTLRSVKDEIEQSMPSLDRQKRVFFDRLLWEDGIRPTCVINPRALLMVSGRVMMQMPDMVTNLAIKIRSIWK